MELPRKILGSLDLNNLWDGVEIGFKKNLTSCSLDRKLFFFALHIRIVKKLFELGISPEIIQTGELFLIFIHNLAILIKVSSKNLICKIGSLSMKV